MITYHLTIEGIEKSLVKWTFENKKLYLGALEPTILMDSLARLPKEIDDQHHSGDNYKESFNDLNALKWNKACITR